MKNSIAARVGRILTGSVRSFIDKLEAAAPEAVMLEALTEVDGALDEVRGQLGKKESERYITMSRLEAATKEFGDLTEQINLAIDGSKEDLAESGVARQLDLEAQIPVLQKSLAECSEEIKELEGYVDAILAKKRDMRQELKTLREATQKAPAGTPASKDFLVKLEKAEEVFDDAIKSPIPGVNINESAKLQDLKELSRKNRIQERLEKIKAERKKD